MPDVKARFEKGLRDIIPRWRPFLAATKFQYDLSSSSNVMRVANPDEQEKASDIAFESALREFKDGQSVWEAADVLTLALARGETEVVERTAGFIVESESASITLKDLARKAIDEPSQPGLAIHQQIASLKRRVNRFPRNAIAWCDLSLNLTLEGSFAKAARSMRVALHLAPNNRFVLRSASRLYVHENQLDVAHSILAGAEATSYDPWLVAAEIATARSAGITSNLMRIGRQMLEDNNYSHYEMSELASALGTIEGDAPTARRLKVRRLISRSLLDPTENSIAQAQWHATNTGFAPSLKIGDASRSILGAPGVHEAIAWQSYIEGDFTKALEEALRWFHDQPFSSRPAFLAAQIASLLCKKPQVAIDVTELALRPNPRDVMLINNLAYAKALLGDIPGACKAIDRIDVTQLDSLSKLYVTATSGAIAFRSGDHENGRLLYLTALEEFKKTQGLAQDFDLYALAFAHLAYEEALAKSSNAVEVFRMLDGLSTRVTRSDFRAIVSATKDILDAPEPISSPGVGINRQA